MPTKLSSRFNELYMALQKQQWSTIVYYRYYSVCLMKKHLLSFSLKVILFS